MATIYKYGIDISKHNGAIDLTPYKDQFVIIRAAWGTNLDEMAERNRKECERLGIPYGVYLYSYALNITGAKAEAEFLLDTVKGWDIKCGVWFDMEDADGYKKKNGALNSAVISDICRTFCSTIEAAGYYVGIYASQSWFGSYIIDCDRYDKWVAAWGTNDGNLQNDTSNVGTLHQFTSVPLDKNVMYAPLSRYDLSSDEDDPEQITTAFVPRLTAPAVNNKFWISTGKGGMNKCLVINNQTGSVLPNCVGYAYGRFMEEAKITQCNLPRTNAETWYIKNDGYKRGSVPKLGAIMCWRGGSVGSSADGMGHVAVVEKIYSDGSVLVSQSNYGGVRWETMKVNPPYSIAKWGLTFQGFIYNPYIDPASEQPAEKTIDELANEVIAGDWGTGSRRKTLLTNAGYDYEAIQKRVNEILSGNEKPAETALKVGDTVHVIDPVTYDGKKFVLYYPRYTVMELIGDRAVIGVNGVVTAAVNVKNLRKVG